MKGQEMSEFLTGSPPSRRQLIGASASRRHEDVDKAMDNECRQDARAPVREHESKGWQDAGAPV